MGSTADLPTATHHSTPPWGRPRSASEQEPGEAWTEVKVADRVVGCTQPVLPCSFLFIRLRPAGLDYGVWQGPFVGFLLAKPLCKAGTGLPEPVFTGGGKGSLSGVSSSWVLPKAAPHPGQVMGKRIRMLLVLPRVSGLPPGRWVAIPEHRPPGAHMAILQLRVLVSVPREGQGTRRARVGTASASCPP